jgi:predicted naringenin-chalcone synthase
MNVRLLSVGVATPANVFKQDEALSLAQRVCCTDDRQRRLAKALYEHAGVGSRYGVLPLSEADR